MADSQPYDYQNLDDKYRQIAQKELGETPERVRAHITSLRRWLQQCSHIQNCPTDDRFLLRFLRVAKFNQEKAQTRLENYCTLRGSPERGLPHYFKRIAMDDPIVDELLNKSAQMPLGYNDRGELIILVRFGAIDPAHMDKFHPVMIMGGEAMMTDERAVIAGCQIIFDMGDMNNTAESMFTRKRSKDSSRIWQDGFAIRQKGLYYYREPVIFDVLMKMMSFWLAPKLVKRIHRVKGDLKKLHERCPGSKKLLPLEYGGDSGTTEECMNRWKLQFREFWTSKPVEPPIVVDEAKRPPESIKYLKEYGEFHGEGFGGTEGTFTKIDAM